MTQLLGLDIGSSSIKAAVLRSSKVVGTIARAEFDTRYEDARAEVEPDAIMKALGRAIRDLGKWAKNVDAIALSVMSPAWVVMDKRGKPLTPIVTHQDRRSVAEATEIESRIGKSRHLRIAGVRPVPGGISSTTWAWFNRHHRGLIKRADLVGHLNTMLIRAWTGERIVDPSNASFMGVYAAIRQSGWSDELRENVRLPKRLLPEIRESNEVAGKLTNGAARSLGLTAGVPVLTGMIDTSSAMLLSGARVGQLLNTCGSTDVLALLTDRPKPHERLITRAFGIGRKWLAVSTIAAAGSALAWAKDQLFSDLSWPKYEKLVNRLALRKHPASLVEFTGSLAGDRMSIEQRFASFSGLKLASTREEMLEAVIDALAATSAERLRLLRASGTPMRRTVMVSGRGFDNVLRRDWPGQWRFKYEDEASLRGLGRLLD